MDSPYANYLIRQFVLAAMTKIAARSMTSPPEQDRIAEMLAKYTTSPELELQQRAVEFASLFTLGETRIGVLEQMPPPELKATVMGVGMSSWFNSRYRVIVADCHTVSEKKPVGSTRGKEVSISAQMISLLLTNSARAIFSEMKYRQRQVLLQMALLRQPNPTKISWLKSLDHHPQICP